MNDIKKIRDRLGLTQHEFATLIGVHSVSIARWESSSNEIQVVVQRICLLIFKCKSFPRPDELRSWINREGGQAALERLIVRGFDTERLKGLKDDQIRLVIDPKKRQKEIQDETL